MTKQEALKDIHAHAAMAYMTGKAEPLQRVYHQVTLDGTHKCCLLTAAYTEKTYLPLNELPAYFRYIDLEKWANDTYGIDTIDARSIANGFDERSHEGSDWECYQFGQEMAKLFLRKEDDNDNN